jgi:hypothetical protein
MKLHESDIRGRGRAGIGFLQQKKGNMKKKLSLIGLAAFAVLAFSPSQARADLLWDFSYVDTATGGNNITTIGTLTTADTLTLLTGYEVPANTYGYQITGMTGTRNSVAVSLQSNPAFPGTTAAGNYFDDALVVNPAGVDIDGLNFYAGGINYNLSVYDPFTSTGGYYDAANANLGNDATLTEVTLTLSAVPDVSSVPEPSSIIAGALMVLPFGASTLRILRKKRAA